MRRYLGVLAAVLSLSAGSAHAATIFSDNFNGENGGVAVDGGIFNYAGFTNFTITGGTVDLIGVGGSYDFFPGNGLYVDLDGSTGDAGLMTSHPFLLGPGGYTLSFYLGGSQRGDTNSVNVNVVGLLGGSYASPTYTLASSDPLALKQIGFAIGVPGDLLWFSFQNAGGDNIGAILDNVALDSNETAPVPEPASLLLLGSGIVAVARRRWLA